MSKLRDRADHWLYVKPGQNLTPGQQGIYDTMTEMTPGPSWPYGLAALLIGVPMLVGICMGGPLGLLVLAVPLCVLGLALLDQERYERKVGHRV